MRREDVYLLDIVEAADAAAGFVAGLNGDDFQRSDLIRSAVLQKLMIIGEAAAKLSPELKQRHPVTPWTRIIGFRNVAAHAYFSLNWQVVWTIATEQLPNLRGQVQHILATEYPQQPRDDAGDRPS